MKLVHDSRDTAFRAPFGAVPVGSEVTLRLGGNLPEGAQALVRLWDGRERLVPMAGLAATVRIPETAGLLWYYFLIKTPDKTVFFGKDGSISETEPESWQITVYVPRELPEWYTKGTVYQIFPDRFARGADWETRQRDAAHPAGWKGTKRMVMQDWEDTPFYCKDAAGRVTRWPFFGGTLAGIREKLPYLRSMGVGAIYLNPIFLASSNHKYDTADYLQIDPGFGDEAEFSRLCKEAEAAGIRVILDGVFSHTGDDSVYFNRYGNFPEAGAYARTGSEYDSWYRFGGDAPCGYECWWGVDSLPNVEETDPGFENFICGENGVIRKWLRLGASGWRLDVADELPDGFIRKIRQAAKAEKADALILGEVWEDASNKISYGALREYLLGDELDCTMHYPFRKAAVDFLLGNGGGEDFAEAMETLRENYPPSALYGALNLISTHDTPRILTVLGEAPAGLSEREQEEFRLDGHHRYLGKMRLKMLSALQFFSPGAPCIYYGDEAGMEGCADPFNRGTYPWGREDEELGVWFRLLGQLRREYPLLVSGTVRYGGEGDVVTVTRTLGDAEVTLYLNRSWETKTWPGDGKTRLDLLGGKVVSGETVEIPPLSALALYREGGQEDFSPLPGAARRIEGKGLLCPVFSLPGKGQVGNLGDAMAFLDAVKEAGFDSWMLLPLCPAGAGDSPYSSTCLLAGDERYVDPEWDVDLAGMDQFCRENRDWLGDYALFAAIHEDLGGPWQGWPAGLRDRTDEAALRRYAGRAREIAEMQYRFSVQWSAVREKAKRLGIRLIGDLPIYAALDSAETWGNRAAFLLDAAGYPTVRAGCPPDYFTPEGQDWGNPIYDWARMERDGFGWWKRRLGQAFGRYDFVRLDHFRAFSSYFAIPAGQPARAGHWMKGPGIAFFRAMAAEFGALPILAEDLGTLDAQVAVLLRQTGLAGMNVWQFSERELAEMDQETLAARVVFSGTHDNQTLRGFLASEGDGRDGAEILENLLQMPAAAVILPVQDVLGLGDEARINVPGVPEGNWRWRMTEEEMEALKRFKIG